MPRGQTAGKKTNQDAERSRDGKPTLGFGVPATSDPHHFKVRIPSANSGKVQISEYLGMQASSDEFAVMDRVVLDRPRWTAIRSEIQRAFNARLNAHGLRTSAWKVGENPVDRLLGKELCVLAWAVEDMEIDKIPIAVRNWLALRPEERWWLFGMTAMVTGTVKDAGRGWRLALRHALGDLAQNDVIQPRARRQIGKANDRPTLDLFDDEI
ncbi:DUF3780 domain-containing protein [Rhizobium leguminosarum]|uniref:anti-phage-associated DUF3780 domain-containing protein n=1 Tax=Rhizobium leguminosarum TaxID=384 RepID=UPI001C95F478|nr:anti-phage-associated DUF3780 domain-containing protein [Rhizobium leguminosarum]MBY5501271.1 DUF3780 domain-containing protein [Rhizobium leguminosarum]